MLPLVLLLAAAPTSELVALTPAPPNGIAWARWTIRGAALPFSAPLAAKGLGAVMVVSGSVTLKSCTGPMKLSAGEAAIAEAFALDSLEVKGTAVLLVARLADGEVAPRACHQTDAGASAPFIVERRASERWPLPAKLGAVHLHAGQHLADRLSIARLELAADAGIPRHLHPGATEAMAATRGAGTLTLDDGGTTVKAGALLTIAPDTWHAFHADDPKGFAGWQVYSPAGPEQRFRKVDAGTPR